ncbi:30S ribosomal protein S19 [Candidatus Hodgkinia cicadicola]|nr:30S ribosomal protein S19 [Candidatus Hodgkinia cicadicola]
MPRSSWKPPFVEPILAKRLLQNEEIITYSRKTYIIPKFIGKTFEIHNGKHFIRLRVTEDMVGHKLGEFAPTRKPCLHRRPR